MELLVELFEIIEESKKKKPKVSKSLRHKVYHADYVKTKDKAYRQYDPEKRSG